ncbi:MAG: hypothetical protein AAF220_09290 [Pseudomonadota bacterium]
MTTRPPASSHTEPDETVSEPDTVAEGKSDQDAADLETSDAPPRDTKINENSINEDTNDTAGENLPEEDTPSVVVKSEPDAKTGSQTQLQSVVSSLKGGLATTTQAALAVIGGAKDLATRSIHAIGRKVPDRLRGPSTGGTQNEQGAADAESVPVPAPAPPPGTGPSRSEIALAERVPLVRSVQLRLVILLLVAVWIIVFPPRGFLEQTYTLSIVLMLLCIGIVQWLCTWPKIYRPGIFAALLCLDCVFMALVAGLQNPFSETPQPLAAALRDRGFLFLTLPILQSVVAANPLFPALSGVCAALCWTGLISYVLSDDVSYSRLDLEGLPAQQLDAAYFDPNFVVIDNAALEVIFLALLGLGLAFFMWRRSRSPINGVREQ